MRAVTSEPGEPSIWIGFAVLLGQVVLAAVVVFALELVFYFVAVMLFPHIDVPSCAATNTFCSPTGAKGPTGGAVVFLTENVAGAGIAVLAAVLLVLRRRTRLRPAAR